MGLFSFLQKDIAIDLGTANSLVYVKGKGIVVREPSVVAVYRNNTVLAVGQEARRMAGKTPADITIIRPLKDGVIADFDITEKMLRYFISKALDNQGFFRVGPRVLVGIPVGVTEVEKRAVLDAAIHAGAKEASLIEEPMAAAIGAGLPVVEATGSMVVDLGGGTSEVAVISMKGMVATKSVRVGGDEMNEAILTYIRKNYNLMIGERTAEEVKIRIGCAFPFPEVRTHEVSGRDLVTGLPKSITVDSEEIRHSITEPLGVILDAIKACLETTPPELAADIVDRGIMLTGGGALLYGLDRFLSDALGLPVLVAEDPLSCVVMGAGKVLENLDTLRQVLALSKRA
ncbi:MAG: rod shape-determining protein [Caldiserica bacterium]|jgi:rod shape-determining protein MreB|nr:rod shape-determining protein [Caldisericota bacterium]MDH7562484.1 rod shape-determining protein [Caldisericota bacterium]